MGPGKGASAWQTWLALADNLHGPWAMRLKDGKIAIVEAEAELVRLIFPANTWNLAESTNCYEDLKRNANIRTKNPNSFPRARRVAAIPFRAVVRCTTC